jgi:hypothetical protein
MIAASYALTTVTISLPESPKNSSITNLRRNATAT